MLLVKMWYSFLKKAFLISLLLMASVVVASEQQSEMQNAAIDAIRQNDVQAIRSLIGEGLDPNYKLGEPRNLMFLAVGYDKPEILEELLLAGGNVDHKLNARMYLSTFIANKNNLELLKPVLAQKPDLNKLMYVNQFTAFTGMLRFVNEKTLRYVLDNSNADINFRPTNGFSPLYLAYERGSCGSKCVKVLLEYGANPCLAIEENGKSFSDYLNDREVTDLLKQTNLYDCGGA
ncbi:hypothetical protein EB809_04195 [Marinobacter sp. R17]|uniref:ankyrin repeat domain-containing protein n=1 Tax=Marinobacter sp. R17 TaxID=2484250 RepID=UPI000F4BF9EC|nr:ankyrin repeat domain-containing protein [Marinobacter sp. R17]ROU01661.1 hypothetical protein EB809_04195 [Marinobacter sp. R17]